MSNAETQYREIVKKLTTEHKEVFEGKMMSSPGIKYKDKVFSFYNKESMGFRLDKELDIHQYAANPKPLSPFKKKPPLKGWWIIDHSESGCWEELAKIALSYTKTL